MSGLILFLFFNVGGRFGPFVIRPSLRTTKGDK